jgi:putative glutamine amidotransferase
VLLPPSRTAVPGPGFGAAEVVSVLDGLVLTGGGDVDPQLYGEAAESSVGGVDIVRDASERALLAAALAIDLPVLAVCRGCQMLNVELGGTLHQHVPDVFGNDDHRHAPSVFGEVAVTTSPGTRTAAVFGDQPIVLCSHHQSINALGSGLVATARAADGVIEAVELPDASFVLGVQWHPEEGGDQRPFAALVAAARQFHQRRLSSAAT